MMPTSMSVSPMALSADFRQGYQVGKDMAQGKRKGLSNNATSFVGALFGLLIFSYFAAEIGPDIITNFTGNSINGTEGDLFALGGLLTVFGILAGVGAAVGIKMS